MKKAILAVVMILSTLFTFGQDFSISVYQVDVLEYSTISGQYSLYKTSHPENMRVTKHGNMFTVTNQDESNYRIGKPLESDDVRCANFIATDKNDEMIGLSFCMYESEKRATMNIIYVEKMAIIYHLRP